MRIFIFTTNIPKKQVDKNLKIAEFQIMHIYDNEYTLIINIYFYETFNTFNPRALVLQKILDTLSDVLDKCLYASL